MRHQIEQLYHISRKTDRIIIGLMSGTSMDGLDIALCRVKGSGGNTSLELLNFESKPFEPRIGEELRKVFAKPHISFEQLCGLNPWIALQHAALINQCLKRWKLLPQGVDLLASHGQTVFHAPKRLHTADCFPNATLQIGDGDHLAVKTGIITLSDFRQKHLAAGGEGAPLAVYGDYLLFSKKDESRALLNIGGISNFTFLPGDLNPLNVFSTDVGPGNTLIDLFTNRFFSDLRYDKDGAIAASGLVGEAFLIELKRAAFFEEPIPKSTGPELFNAAYVEEALAKSKNQLEPKDILCTLTHFTADTIASALRHHTNQHKMLHVYVSGGGFYNGFLMSLLTKQLPHCVFSSTDALGIRPDAKEAVLFAILANETVAGEQTINLGGPRSGIPNVSMGKISFPG